MALIAAHLNAGHSGGDGVAIGICSPSLSPPIPPPSPFSPSLMVFVDVKHHVYLLHPYYKVPGEIKRSRDLEEGGGAGPSS